jgi:NAD-dependent DNA ligase
LFRGELIISKKNFKKINNQFKNARNAVAGLVNSKQFSIEVAKLTDFISYSIFNPRYKHNRQMLRLKQWKVPLVYNTIKHEISNEFLSELLNIRREKALYEIDGIVVIDSSKTYKVTNNNPSYGFAFKKVLTDQIAEVTIAEVEWNPSKDGYLKPRIRIQPVTIGGVEISYVTGHNAKFIIDNNIGPGSIVKLIRSGDVIPYIQKVLVKSNKPQLPNIPYKWNKSKVDFIVQDIHGQASDNIKIKQITFFFKTMKVKYISEGIVTKLVDNGYDSIIKIIGADIDNGELSNIDGIGSVLVNKIFDNICKVFGNTTLYRLMSASNLFGRGMGIKRIKSILDVYPDIMNKQWNTNILKQNIINIDGFDDITASQFSNNLNRFKKFFNDLNTVIDIDHLLIVKKKDKTKDNKLNNMKIVFTGFRDNNLEQQIEDKGGKVSSSVSKNTNLVVYVPTNKLSSKIKKAQSLDIPIITKDDFIKQYL